MDRELILETAKQYVTKDRNSQYGEPEDNFARIAELWTMYLSHGGRRFNVTSLDVGLMMALLKFARIENNPTKADSFIDMAGYVACAGQIATSEDDYK